MAYEDILEMIHEPDLPYFPPTDYEDRPSGLPWEGYYYSAYGIAVKHGYTGSEEEWLRSLKGERGFSTELRYNAETNYLEWKYEDETEWHELMSLTELQTELEAATIAEVEDARDAAEGYAESAGVSADSAATSAEAASLEAGNASTYAANASASAAIASTGADAAELSATRASGAAEDAESAKAAAQTAASNAQTSASNAGTSAAAAAQSATDAAGHASAASASASSAASSASAAAGSAESASVSATSAANSANTAEQHKTAAAGSAAAASQSASAAATSETNADGSATAAAASASAAAGSASSAEESAAEATGSAAEADQSASEAQNSATAASTSATNAANSAEAAGESATAASGSAASASASETNAAASETNAANSASAAGVSATNAEGSATAASGSATAAAGSAAAAAGSATDAAGSATSAAVSAAEAAAILEEFTTPTASATTLESGQPATASYADGHFTFGLPRGAQGAQGNPGTDGDDGFSPVISVTAIAGGHRVTVTDAQGSRYFDVMDGEGSGDMVAAVYDADSSVASAGGIAAYVEDHGGKIDTIKRNGTALPITDKAVNVSVPTALSELTADSTHRLVTDAEKATWSGKQNAISDLDTIRSGAALGATAVQTETDPVFSASAAKNINASDISDWNGKYVKPSGGIPKTDLESSVQTSLGRADTALQSFTETDPVFSASAAHGISSSDISNWNGKQAAISDLAAIRSGAALGATALQSYTETDPVFTASAAHGISASDITNWNNKGTYSKPSSGIPKTDLASAVQTSLGLADTALQSFTESDPVFAASAAHGITSSDISAWNGKQSKIAASGILKGDGSGGVSAATAGTDYAAASHNHTLANITNAGTVQMVVTFSDDTTQTYNVVVNTE